MPQHLPLIDPSRVITRLKKRPIVIKDPPPFLDLRAPFNAHAKKLKGAPGSPISGIEPSGQGLRVRYQNGVIYQRKDGGTNWVHGAINDRYEELGAGASWLGLPISDEMDFPDAGRVSVFQHGSIYWWSDVGAIDLNNTLVQYTGLICDEDSAPEQASFEDEPYAILGVLAPDWNNTTRTQIYEDVVDDEARGDLIELYRGKPNGVIISTRLMEHDFGNADQYRDVVRKAVKEAWDGMKVGIGYIPLVGPILQKGADELWPIVKDGLVDTVNKVLDTADDDLGGHVLVLTPKDMVLLAARTPTANILGVTYKTCTSVLGAPEGAKYQVLFNVSAV
ncbi:hypothetical protein AC792_09710 [Arthrobacter sp. RIT-PI-e]|uniref:LGFP repeat-containing protein n=1 Tax=Arthrobacter sp. RIT-PI-e TaxID=1681197 RepID=UPI0006769B3D|nr:hypothetical protein [Arthrobacter sp. RIT-PI-e]KNC18857.1 hypothetical protein AC792_09710 [Arthrobacter sp. RIT-PI-e]